MQSLGMATPASATSASSMPKASLFSSAGGRNFNNSNARMSSRFETPGLTPIPANASILAQSPSDVGGHQDPRVVRRAQQVAARLYYEPSPETPHTAEIRTSLQYLRGLGRQADPAATPNAGETPLRRGGRAKEGNDNAIPSTMSASSFARKPRALVDFRRGRAFPVRHRLAARYSDSRESPSPVHAEMVTPRPLQGGHAPRVRCPHVQPTASHQRAPITRWLSQALM